MIHTGPPFLGFFGAPVQNEGRGSLHLRMRDEGVWGWNERCGVCSLKMKSLGGSE